MSMKTQIFCEILPLIISTIALIFSFVTFKITYSRDKIHDTIDAYTKLQAYLYHFYEYPEGDIETFVDDRESDEYKLLSNSLAQIEIFATGIKNDLYKFDIAYKMSHGFLDGALRDKIEYMLDMKSWSNNAFYGNTRWLLEEMDKETKKGSR